MCDIFKVFKELEKLKAQIIKLIEKLQEAEDTKELLIKKLWEAEAEKERLKEERDRLSNLCRIKDRIIERK